MLGTSGSGSIPTCQTKQFYFFLKRGRSMSRGTLKNATRSKNPVKYWLSWKGDTGVFQYWDGEKSVEVGKLTMLVLDRRSTVTGWSDMYSSRIFSNTVKNLKEDFIVRSKNATIARGKWEDIKEIVKQAGGNFTVNIYALAKLDDSDELEPVCLQVDKTCLKSWSDFTENNELWKIYKGLVTVQAGEEQKKGKIKYYVTSFVLSELEDEELNKQAKAFDIEHLQPYFNGEETAEEKAPF
jgi:hypothetical protein